MNAQSATLNQKARSLYNQFYKNRTHEKKVCKKNNLLFEGARASLNKIGKLKESVIIAELPVRSATEASNCNRNYASAFGKDWLQLILRLIT